jgi:hypothetical protein
MSPGDAEHRDAAGLASSNILNASELGETTTVTSCECNLCALLEIKYRLDCTSGPLKA